MRIVLALAHLLFVLGIGAAWPVAAAGSKPPVSPAILQPSGVPPEPFPAGAQALCTLGTSGPRAWLLDYLQPPGDAYYLHVTPIDCSACALSPGVWISRLHMTLEFRAACSIPVQVAVVAAHADTLCRTPDDVRILSGPWSASMAAPAPGTYDFSLALSHPAPVMDDAYLRITFMGESTGCATNATRPRLVTSSSCVECSIWNYYPADSADLCQLLVPGTPLIWADIDSCVSAARAGVGPNRDGPRSLRVSPNPVRGMTTIEFALAEPADALVEIVDVSGRRVRSLWTTRLGPGPHALSWDGRDDMGARVPPGAYLAVVRGSAGVRSKKVVVIR